MFCVRGDITVFGDSHLIDGGLKDKEGKVGMGVL
jgi:hypothetical protein